MEIENDISIEIEQYRLDQEIASFSPNYKKCLQMEESLKEIENQIGSCKDILQLNTLNDQRDLMKQSILDFLKNWASA